VVLREERGGFRDFLQAEAEQKSGTVSDGAEQDQESGTSARRIAVYQDSTLDRILHVEGVAVSLSAAPAEHGLCLGRDTDTVLCCTVYLAMPSDQAHGVWIGDGQLGSDQGRNVSLPLRPSNCKAIRSSMRRRWA
jgi:hypothetical protein